MFRYERDVRLHRLVGSLVALATLALARPAPADVPTPATEVLGALHELDAFDMRIGEIARRRGTTAEVRRFGDLLAREHRLADDAVRRVSHAYGFVYAPPEPADRVREDARLERELREANGAALDARFLATAAAVEAGAARYLREVEPRLSRNDMRALVDRLLPLLDEHAAIARRLEGKP